MRAVAPVAGTAAAQGSSALSDSGFLTTTTPTALLVAANLVDAGTTTAAGENFASRVPSSQGSLLEDRTVMAPGSYNATAPVAPDGAWIMQLVAFRAVNTAPSLGLVSNQSHFENTEIVVWLAAVDPDGDVLTYDALDLPDGLGVTNASGLIAGHLTFASAGVRTVTATVSDGEVTTSRTFTWTVANVNRAPALTAVADQTSVENATIALPLAASDPDGTPLSYSATGLPASLSVDPATGFITGTLTYTSAGTYAVTAAVSDGSASSSRTFTWTVTNVNRVPVVTAIGDQTHAEDATVTLATGASDPDGDTLTFSATGLPNGLVIHATTGAITGTLSYTSAGVHAVTVTASDGTLAGSQAATWTVANVNREPDLTPVADRTDAEDATVSLPVVATDPDGDVVTFSAIGLPAGLTINASTGLISGTLSYVSAGAHVVTVFAADGDLICGYTFTWTVTNVNREPDLAAVVNRTDAENATVSLPLVASDPDGDAVTYGAIGLPAGLTISTSTGLITGTLSYVSAGTHLVTVLASDGDLVCGYTFTWTVTNVNQAPVLTALTGRTDAENATVSLPLVASDPDGDNLTYSATGLPDGLAIHPATGVISGTLSFTSAGTHQVTVTATDPTLASISTSVTWTVTDMNRAPVVQAIADQNSAENTTIAQPVTATDPDGDTLTFSATGLPSGLAINSVTGTITGTLAYDSAGPHTVVVTASDGMLSNSRTFPWTVTNVNREPVVTAIAGQTTAENVAVTLETGATDPDGDTVTFTAAGLPNGLTINAATGVITGTLTYTSAGTHPVTVTATDPGLATGSQTFTWTVTNVNQLPTLTDVPDRTDPENTVIAVQLAGADLDTGTTLTYSAAPLPPGITLNAATGLIEGTLTYTSAGVHTVTVSVSDGTASADQTFAWTVTNVNQPPTLTDVPDRTDPENTLVAIPLAGADLDAGTTLTYSAGPLPAGITLNAATGLIEGTLTYTSAGVHTVTVSVSDGTASAEQTFTWTVTNVNQPPTLTDVPDRTDPENTLVAIPLAGADLDAGTTLTYSASPLPAGITVNATTGLIEGTLTYTSAGVHTITVSVSDGTASADQTFTWTVTNVNQPPTLTDVPDRTDPENTVVAIPLAGADLDAAPP